MKALELFSDNLEVQTIFSLGPALSRNLEMWPIFELSRVAVFIGCVQTIIRFSICSIHLLSCLIGIGGKVVCSIEAGALKGSNASSNFRQRDLCVVWPKNLWGGYQEELLPSELRGAIATVLTYSLSRQYFRLDKTRIRLTLLLICHLVQNKSKFSLKECWAQLCWILSSEPTFLLALQSKVKSHLNHTVKRLYFPLEFYPETRAFVRNASFKSLVLTSAQHCFWESDVLENLAVDRIINKLDVLYVADERSARSLSGAAHKVKVSVDVGRYKRNLSLDVTPLPGGENEVMCLTNSRLRSILAAVELLRRLSKRKIKRLGLHPATPRYLVFMCYFIGRCCGFITLQEIPKYLPEKCKFFVFGSSVHIPLERKNFKVKVV